MPASMPPRPQPAMSQLALASIMAGPLVKVSYLTSMLSSLKKPSLSAM